HGIELVADQSERNEIARLNLIAGQKAKAAIAHNTAQKYLATARVWLAASSWQTNYGLTLDLYLETTELAYLCGDFEQVEHWVAIVVQEGKTVLDIVKVYEVKIQTDMAQSQPLKAINTALQVLQQLGISFPQQPSKSDIQLELDAIASLFGEKPIGDLSHLPKMTEPEKLAAMRILSSITIAAYIAVPDLMPLLVSKQVNLSIQYGNAFVSPFAYATFGMILCGMVGNIESGYQFVLHLLSTQAAIAIENAKLYSKLRASESKMTQFLEAVPVGIGVVDMLGRPYYANQQAIQLLGKGIVPSATPDQLAEVYQLYLAGTDQPYPIDNLPVMRALSGERTRIDDLEIHQNNATIPVEGWGTPIFDEQGNVAYAIAAFQDITERKQAEQLLANYNRTLEQQVRERTAALQQSEAALREREQELRLITDALPVCICYIDTDQRYRFANQTYEDWYGCSRDQILGKQVREVMSETTYQIIEPYINRALAGQITTYEAEISLPFGKKYVAVTSIPDIDRNAQVRGYYGLIADISEQRNAALRERKSAEEASILEERNRIAREIHDTLAQAFTSIIVHLDAASQRLTIDPDAAESHLKTGRILARSGLADARRSVEALRPQILEEGDLHSALDRLATQMFSHTTVQVVCKAIGEPHVLPNEVEANLLRIGQEALTNAFKYANASEIQVELRYERCLTGAERCLRRATPTQFVLQIKDNGQGFESSSLSVIRGFGLLGMTERAQRIGAELTIQSHLGQGTEIVVRVQTP
ncbi:PAS domain-containing sensor histidine kinase, partial [Nostoc sp.]|uniref:PAS domain-containing sensor histidine kinase n=1 Tax=Nostoc sp. TaxID=1180 RepID=UPI002FF8A9DB